MCVAIKVTFIAQKETKDNQKLKMEAGDNAAGPGCMVEKRESGWSLVGLLKTSQQVPEIKRETKGEEFDYLKNKKNQIWT